MQNVNNLSVNDQYYGILFEITRQINNGLILPTGIQIPDNLLEAVQKFLDLKELKFSIIKMENNFNLLMLNAIDNESKLTDFRFSYYRKIIDNFNKDIVRRKGICKLVIHPLDYKFNQDRLKSEIDLSNMYSGFIEYIYPEFVSGNNFNPPHIELKLEPEFLSVERAIKEIDNYLKYVEDFDFNPIKFKFSRDSVYKEVIEIVESDKLMNYKKWFNFKFTSYVNGDLIIVEKKY